MKRRNLVTALAAGALALAAAAAADAATLTNAGGVLTYSGTPAVDAPQFTETAAGVVRVTLKPGTDPITASPGCTQPVAGTWTCTGVNSVVANGGAGNDEISAAGLSTIPSHVRGGDGDDSLTGGAVADVVDGESGDDVLNDSPGDDTFIGGDGNDIFLLEFTASVPTAADVRGGPGVDAVVFAISSATDAAVSITLDDIANDGVTGWTTNLRSDVEQVETIAIGAGTVSFTMRSGAGSQSIGSASSGEARYLWTRLGATASPYDIDAGPGSDVLSGGPANDTIAAVDGYGDVITCGAGVDTVTADSFDSVAADCENVSRTHVIPNPLDDRPPTVTLTAPAPGAVIHTTAPTMLAATATDDHGVAKVQFLAGTRIVCEDTTAPYTCAYTPTGADAPFATLAAVVTDTAGQIDVHRVPVGIGRFATTIRSTTTPRRNRTAPFRFVTSGVITPPAGMPARLACSAGAVTMIVRAGTRIVARKTVVLNGRCTYRATTAFNNRTRFRGAKRLTFLVRFSGNPYLAMRQTPTRVVRVN